ncbi:hypothetical protein RNJ44_00378 [Nakaseomyces bracarensis]|uniref:Uncharacterized protein n=1 Tax=Nakaseomyces bracarensis TaxID=273131 RepID=A0ABR4NSC8_9SACH
MAYTKTAILIAAAAALASAQTPQQVDELNIILNDVKSHLSQYMALVEDPSSGITIADLPAGVLSLGMAMATATDSSYTTLYKDVDFNAIVPFLTKLPWYSQRLETELAKDLETSTSSSAVETTSSTEVPSSSSTEAPSTSSTEAPSTSSTEVHSTSSTEAASSSKSETSPAASSKAEESSSKATPSSSKASSSATPSKVASTTVSTKATSASASTTKAAISQIGDGQIQAQTTNGAAKVAGMGAGIFAAAALLL